jgi:cytochrome c peroxidase
MKDGLSTGNFLVLAVLFCLATSSASSTAGQAAVQRIPRGIPANQWRKRIPSDNAMTADKIKLGEALYFDKRLSADATISCATCHDPASAFTDRNATAVGIQSSRGTRSAPTVLNAMFSDIFFWDGRARSLEEQAMHPLINPAEMGMQDYDAVVARVASVTDYVQRFRRVFKSEVTIDTIVKAIAAYERTQLSGNSPFDRFIAGDPNAITSAQKRGWKLFRSKAQCIQCHAFSLSSPFFTDFDFHNTGVASKYRNFDRLVQSAQGISASKLAHAEGFSDLGRYLVTLRPNHIGAFKTPTLRDIELTAPYMHEGSQKTLLDVVRFYNRGGEANPYLDERISPLNLTDEEMNALVEFMRSLTSDEVLRRAQTSRPQNRLPAQ